MSEPSIAAATALHRLVDRMSHQLKNPLQAIVVNAEVVRIRTRREAPELWAELDRFAAAVDSSVQLLDRRLRLLVQMARADDEGATAVDLGATVRELVGAAKFDSEDVPVHLEAPTADLPAARARPGHLVHLLFVLLERAVGGSGGEVVVRATPLPERGVGLTVVRRSPAEPPPFRECGWEEVSRLARQAGGEATREADGAAARLSFPAG